MLVVAGAATIALQLAPGISGLYAIPPIAAALLAGGICAAQRSKGARAASPRARPEILLKTAIESTPNGLCIFDADLRGRRQQQPLRHDAYRVTPGADPARDLAARDLRQPRGRLLLPAGCGAVCRPLPRQGRFPGDGPRDGRALQWQRHRRQPPSHARRRIDRGSPAPPMRGSRKPAPTPSSRN